MVMKGLTYLIFGNWGVSGYLSILFPTELVLLNITPRNISSIIYGKYLDLPTSQKVPKKGVILLFLR